MHLLPLAWNGNTQLPVLAIVIFATGIFLALITHSRYSGNKSETPIFKDAKEKDTRSASDVVEYRNVFPPSQRGTLLALGDQFAKESVIDLSKTPRDLITLDTDFRTANPKHFIFSGFNVGDVVALGDFPDFATLSGVPLPSPLSSFDINKALPRPYRPFRWAYHQTMCKC
jgi:hypothetical protein